MKPQRTNLALTLVSSPPPETVPYRTWIRLAVGFLVLGLAALLLARDALPEDWHLHGAWCFAGLIILLPVLRRAVRAGIAALLADHRVMFSGAFGFYFLFGALLLAIGPQEQIDHSLTYYAINAPDAMRANAVNAIGFGIALLVATWARGRWLARRADRVAAVAANVPVDVVVFVFFILAAVASFNVLSADLGLRTGVVSGIWRASGRFALVVILLASSHRGRGEQVLRLLAVVLTAVESMGGLLLFNKSATMLPLAALMGGLAMRYGVRRVLPLGFGLLIVSFATISGPATYGRNIIGLDGRADFQERWNTLREGFTASQSDSPEAEHHTWSRLCYAPPQVAALDFYDAGLGGDDLRLIPWLFVPRIIAPHKPVISQSGADFHTKITGQEGSATGSGIFASGYYNAGWAGVLLAGLLCGWILAQTSAIVRAIMLRRALLLLPIGLMGLYIAFRIDGHFVSDYLGAFMFVLYPLLLGSGLAALNPPRRTAR